MLVCYVFQRNLYVSSLQVETCFKFTSNSKNYSPNLSECIWFPPTMLSQPYNSELKYYKCLKCLVSDHSFLTTTQESNTPSRWRRRGRSRAFPLVQFSPHSPPPTPTMRAQESWSLKRRMSKSVSQKPSNFRYYEHKNKVLDKHVGGQNNFPCFYASSAEADSWHSREIRTP